APVAAATLINRFAFRISAGDELVLVAACVALLGSGILCQLRASTLFGSLILGAYILMVLIHLIYNRYDQGLMGIYFACGGALLFGAGLALAFYRDRLLTLPDRIKRREGIFRVFGWR